MVRILAAMLLVLTASAVSVTPAHACSCVQWTGLREAVTSAEVTFAGVPVAESLAGKDRAGFGPLIATTFRVEQASIETAPWLPAVTASAAAIVAISLATAAAFRRSGAAP
jgi:hypothetical protein